MLVLVIIIVFSTFLFSSRAGNKKHGLLPKLVNGGLRLPNTTTIYSKAHVKTHGHWLYCLRCCELSKFR